MFNLKIIDWKFVSGKRSHFSERPNAQMQVMYIRNVKTNEWEFFKVLKEETHWNFCSCPLRLTRFQMKVRHYFFIHVQIDNAPWTFFSVNWQHLKLLILHVNYVGNF